MQKDIAQAIQPETKAAIECMNAYFRAQRRGAPRQEVKQLEKEWFEAIRRLRTVPPEHGSD